MILATETSTGVCSNLTAASPVEIGKMRGKALDSDER